MTEPTTHEFTPDQIEAGIASALDKHKFDVIPSLIKLLALQDPERAQKALDALHGRYTLQVQL
ncbi:MAG TPA: hypothetical protein VJT49_16850 [Amycolatopsis sp.]|uniref:hypothetical protein n=1 Tax=Amycolatopsis sp. TaxID=37632 RepID=UPI002B47EF3D|nr:hypothetical protein [Amycolatopsis sp.]HKS46743.1 hypothetical protein [Amycolatopsis sp.]